ncbi:MAG: hypothetical protein AAF936_12740 [Pseudomonadota bacterium]
MPDQDGTPAIALAAIDPYAIPGWSSSDIVSPDRRALAPPLPEPEERPPLDYDVRLVAYIDCMAADAAAELCDIFHDFYLGLLGFIRQRNSSAAAMTASASKTSTGCAGEEGGGRQLCGNGVPERIRTPAAHCAADSKQGGSNPLVQLSRS